MLAISQVKDLFAGKLTDELAVRCLQDLSKQKPSPVLIKELVQAIQEISEPVSAAPGLQSLSNSSDFIDCCGTGGSGMPHYNTSTSVAFVLAAGGLKVAKFGNRSASGASGSFDFLEFLGMPISLPPAQLPNILEKTNLIFLFAPQFYPTLAKLAPLRKAIPGRTIFNLIGPLLNPLNPPLRMLGAATRDSQQAIAEYLHSLPGNKKSYIVRAESGIDELDPSSNNSIMAVSASSISETILAAKKSNDKLDNLSLKAPDNAHLFTEMISDFSSAPMYFRSLVTLNAGAAFLLSGKVQNIQEGQQLAGELLQSGKVLAKYEQCRRVYAQHA